MSKSNFYIISGRKVTKKNFEKIREKFRNFFFRFFRNFFSIEMITRERRLRTQNFMIVGQTVSAVGERTDKRTWGFIIDFGYPQLFFCIFGAKIQVLTF